MTGPEHYAEAERLLKGAIDAVMDENANFMVASAQVHATLAQVAAYVTAQPLYGYNQNKWGYTDVLQGEWEAQVLK